MSKQPEALLLADIAETLCVPHTGIPAKAGVLAAAELRRLHSLNAELVDALKAALATLKRENERSGGPITDTIWHTNHETLFDFLAVAIENAEAQQ